MAETLKVSMANENDSNRLSVHILYLICLKRPLGSEILFYKETYQWTYDLPHYP
jgi:hypothetical protein